MILFLSIVKYLPMLIGVHLYFIKTSYNIDCLCYESSSAKCCVHFQIVNRFCGLDWEQLSTTYMNSFVINNESTTLQSTVNPACKGDNWAINVNGSDAVSTIFSI